MGVWRNVDDEVDENEDLREETAIEEEDDGTEIDTLDESEESDDEESEESESVARSEVDYSA